VVDALKIQGPVVYASVDVTAALESIESAGEKRIKPLPRFPSVTRDLAIVVEEQRTSAEIVDAIKRAAQGLAEEISLFDIYRKEPVEPGRKSMAFHVVYRDPTTTLTDTRVDQVHEQITRSVEKQFGGMVRAAS
jgi:phenylalanyl-tRNA synthetase beta chain